MKKKRKIISLILSLVMLLSVFSVSPSVSIISAEDVPVTIKGGDLSMVPGDFSVLRFEAEEGVEIDDVRWGVDKNNIVTVDEKTGRIDAIGSGTATIKLTVLDGQGNNYTTSSKVTVSGGPTPIVEPIPELQNNNRPDFMMGADVSSLYQIMKEDKKYYDLNGEEAHLFDILAENGVNWVRLRVWNNPYDEFGNPYGGGNSNIDTTIELAKQAQERNMKINVVFHYSDFWAHPGQQRRPATWSDLTGQDLVDAMREFTTISLTKMKDAGVYPNMVTIGNETNSNILDVNLNLGNGNMNSTAVDIFKAGSEAVRSTDPNVDHPEKRALVSFHLANGNNTWLYNNFTAALHNNDVDYDALGASYYPSWHGTYNQVLNNLNNISETYGKYVYIAETAYPWTLREDAGDDTPQNFKHGDVSTVGLAASVQGQATALREVINVAASINNEKGLGAFYWEPAWLPGPTTGWATPYGTGWETAGFFDINGYALPSVQTFNLVRGEQTVPEDSGEYSYGWETTVTVNQGSQLSMPSTILAVKNNGMMGNTPRSINRQPVVWNEEEVASVDVNTPGEYIVFGSVATGENNAFAHVIVRESSSARAERPTFNLPNHSSVPAGEDGYSYSARHVQNSISHIELETETANASIYFTLDGSDPRNGNGSTREYVGGPWVRNHDSIRVYAGPIQISQNVEIRAISRRNGYNYVSGSWGSDIALLQNSPEIRQSFKAIYDYSSHLLVNGGFETGDLSGWNVTGNATTAEVIEPEDYVTHSYAGDNSFKFSLNAGESMTLSQDVNLPDGVYSLSLFARGDNQTNGETEMSIKATSGGKEFSSNVRTFNVPQGSMIWRKYSIDNIEVKDGKVTISFDAETSGSYTGYLDHFVMEKNNGELNSPYEILQALTEQFIAENGGNKGNLNSLISILEAAKTSEEKGNMNSRDGQLKAFGNQVKAQSGKSLSHEQGDALLNWLNRITQ